MGHTITTCQGILAISARPRTRTALSRLVSNRGANDIQSTSTGHQPEDDPASDGTSPSEDPVPEGDPASDGTSPSEGPPANNPRNQIYVFQGRPDFRGDKVKWDMGAKWDGIVRNKVAEPIGPIEDLMPGGAMTSTNHNGRWLTVYDLPPTMTVRKFANKVIGKGGNHLPEVIEGLKKGSERRKHARGWCGGLRLSAEASPKPSPMAMTSSAPSNTQHTEPQSNETPGLLLNLSRQGSEFQLCDEPLTILSSPPPSTSLSRTVSELFTISAGTSLHIPFVERQEDSRRDGTVHQTQLLEQEDLDTVKDQKRKLEAEVELEDFDAGADAAKHKRMKKTGRLEGKDLQDAEDTQEPYENW